MHIQNAMHSVVSSVKMLVLTKSNYAGNEPAAHVRSLAITFLN